LTAKLEAESGAARTLSGSLRGRNLVQTLEKEVRKDGISNSMDAKTKGAWLVHHTHKLEQVNNVHEFDNIYAAGKTAILLSALSASDQTSLPHDRVKVLAKASNINTLLELPKLLELLEARSLIQTSKSGIDVLGVTTAAVVQHAAGVYDDLNPSSSENAALAFSELSSQAPQRHKETKLYLGDTCKLTTGQAATFLEQAEQVGFIDFEDLGGDKVYFNGNLFRREHIAKTQAVLDSLTEDDRKRVGEVEELLKKLGCVSLTQVTKVLGAKLLEKLNAISMYDISVVNNDQENVAFVTRPAAFSKFGNPLVEDALDLAKAFVSSLTYGMTRSTYARGRITMFEKLMKALIAGRWVGPVEAIGQDYRALELKGVVEVRPSPPRGCEMRLLKKEVGQVALEVIKAGDASDAVLNLPGATVTGYVGPETNRESSRRKQQVASKRATRDIVMALRTGSALK
jgi:hypothetical protein